MKKCKHCGADNSDDSKFCLNCGHSFDEDSTNIDNSNLKSDNDIQQNLHNHPSSSIIELMKQYHRKIIIGLVVLIVTMSLGRIFSGTPVDQVKLDYSSASLDLGKYGELKATILPDDATDKSITWSSSDSEVAEIDSNGKITAKKIGTTVITAKSSNGKTDTCELTVVQPGPDFSSIYYSYLDSSYATLGSDGSYLEIDTNPYDIEDYTDSDAVTGLAYAIYELDLPGSLAKKFDSTRAIDGRQSETYGDVNVSWSYHPDTGLEVLFSAK